MCKELIDGFMEEMKGLGFSKQEIIQMITKNSGDIPEDEYIRS